MKMGASITTGKLAAAGAVAAGLSVGGALLVFSAAIDISPKPTAAQSSPAPERGSDDDRALLLASLRDLIEQSRAVLSATSSKGRLDARAGGIGGETTSIVLWMRDDHSPGVVNLGELLVISHRPILGAITATTFESDSADSPGPAAPAHVLNAPDPVEALRSAGTAVTRVIATDVRAVSIDQARSSGEKTQLTLTLTWEAPGADAPPQSVISAVAPLRRTH